MYIEFLDDAWVTFEKTQYCFKKETTIPVHAVVRYTDTCVLVSFLGNSSTVMQVALPVKSFRLISIDEMRLLSDKR